MPKHDPMAQISRPFQIAFAVVVLFAGVWLFALQGRFNSSNSGSSTPAASSSPASSSSASSTPTSSAATRAKAGGSSSHIYHGSVPGLEGLTRDVSRAHEAVTKIGAAPQTHGTSPATPAPAPHTSAPHSSSSVAASAPAATRTAAKHAVKTAAKPATKTAITAPASAHRGSSTARHASGAVTLTGQRTVEAELKKGDVVLLLFWNSNGSDDVTVHRALQQVRSAARSPHQPIAVQEASASQVASYGSVTRGVQVYATPTLFVINKKGQALVLTGVQDAFSIEQAISEARSS
jgi:uncharacterized protein (UPF0333 family)